MDRPTGIPKSRVFRQKRTIKAAAANVSEAGAQVCSSTEGARSARLRTGPVSGVFIGLWGWSTSIPWARSQVGVLGRTGGVTCRWRLARDSRTVDGARYSVAGGAGQARRDRRPARDGNNCEITVGA